MLAEKRGVSQIEGEGFRRWFMDEFFDLIVWYEEGRISGFQLCYDKFNNERALTWRRESGYSHNRIDDGEAITGRYKMSPILVADGSFSYREIADRFRAESREIDPEVADFVHQKLLAYPGR